METEIEPSNDSDLILKKVAESSKHPYITSTYRTEKTAFNSFVIKEKSSVETQTDISHSEVTFLCSRHELPIIDEEKIPNAITENPDLCASCSTSMLSYIVLIQKFLDGLSKDICKQIDPLTECFKCVKERLSIPERDCHTCNKSTCKDPKMNRHCDCSISDKLYREKGGTVESKLKCASSPEIDSIDCEASECSSDIDYTNNCLTFNCNQEKKNHGKTNTYKMSYKAFDEHSNEDKDNILATQKIIGDKHLHHKSNKHQNYSEYSKLFVDKKVQQSDIKSNETQKIINKKYYQYENLQTSSFKNENLNQQTDATKDQNEGRKTVNFEKDEIKPTACNATKQLEIDSMVNEYQDLADNFKVSVSYQYPHNKVTDDILSTLHKVECGLQNISKIPSAWDRITEINRNQQIQRNFDQAFVTIVRNNAEVLGALVLGASLLLCGTSMTLCILVYDSVNTDLIAPLSSTFHEVLHTRSLDSVGSTKLNLLDQPELGISFAKLNVWRLVKFAKCVYLNPDTLVVQNCDELFHYEELSAVPDIGWPDCFNSGVFVFRPSIQTFSELLEFAEKQESYDGGEQGLLNSYFDSWPHDIHKKLSFIYNLMANVSYTYAPAFRQFGRNVKVVQFLGALKPWHVKFFNDGGQIAEPSVVHDTYVQFVQLWLKIYRISVLPLLSLEIQSFVMSCNSLSASEILRFFPSTVESEVDFLLIPPSVRIKPYQQSVQVKSASSIAIEKLQLPIRSNNETDIPQVRQQNTELNKDQTPEAFETAIRTFKVVDDCREENTAENSILSRTLKSNNLIPGSEVGDYEGMIAWEQGRMDYEGSSNSDTIIKRLNYLIDKNDDVI